MAYQLDPVVQAFLTRFPPAGPFDRNRCPDCHRWAFVDLGRQEVICYRHDPPRRWTLAERLALAERPSRLPAELRQYYPGGVTCPVCQTRLALRVRWAEGTCPHCETTWTFADLIDRAAQRLMEEEPNGAQGYRKPRHTR